MHTECEKNTVYHMQHLQHKRIALLPHPSSCPIHVHANAMRHVAAALPYLVRRPIMVYDGLLAQHHHPTGRPRDGDQSMCPMLHVVL